MLRSIGNAFTVYRQAQDRRRAMRRAGLRWRIDALVEQLHTLDAAGGRGAPEGAKLVGQLERTLRVAERLLTPEERARMADDALARAPLNRHETDRLLALRTLRPLLPRRPPTTPNPTPHAARSPERPAARE